MTPHPDFSRFHAATKCDPALLMDPPELLLDRTARRQWSIPEPTREAMLLAVVTAVTVVIGWHGYQQRGDTRKIEAQTRKIEAQIAQLVAIQARQAELERIVDNDLMDADRADNAVVRAIERAR